MKQFFSALILILLVASNSASAMQNVCESEWNLSGKSVQATVVHVTDKALYFKIDDRIAELHFDSAQVRYESNFENMIGRTFHVSLLKYDRSLKTILLKSPSAIDALYGEKLEAIAPKIVAGSVYQAEITRSSLGSQPLSARIGSHHMDMSLSPEENAFLVEKGIFLTIGATTDVYVKTHNSKDHSISITHKALADEWKILTTDYAVGSRVTGKVLKVIDSGLLVQIKPLVVAFMHKTETVWAQENASKEWAVGDQIDAVISEIDPISQHLRLRKRPPVPEDWFQNFGLEVGQSVDGFIRIIYPYGILVGLPNGADGLIRNKDIVQKHAHFEICDKVHVTVLSILKAQKTIRLRMDTPREL